MQFQRQGDLLETEDGGTITGNTFYIKLLAFILMYYKGQNGYDHCKYVGKGKLNVTKFFQ